MAHACVHDWGRTVAVAADADALSDGGDDSSWSEQ
jgi:hypothetical protein